MAQLRRPGWVVVITAALLAGLAPVGVATAQMQVAAEEDPVAGHSREPLPGQFYTARARVLDNVRIEAGAETTVRIAGVGGLPAANLASVAVNVAAKGAWFNTGSLAVRASDAPEPTTTALDYNPNTNQANLVTAAVGADGAIKVRNRGNQAANATLDVLGYTLTTPDAQLGLGGSFVPLTPAKLLDNQVVAAAGNVELTPLGAAGIPTEGVTAVALDVVASSPRDGGTVRVYPAGEAWPVDATLEYTAGRTARNLAITTPGEDGKINAHNLGFGAATLTVTAVGYFTDTPVSPGKGVLRTAAQARVATDVTVPAGGEVTLDPRGQGKVPAGADAVGLNVTAKSSGTGAVAVRPAGTADTGGQTAAYAPGTPSSGFALTGLGADGRVTVRNSGSAPAVVSLDLYSYTTTIASLELDPHAAAPGDTVAVRANDLPASVTTLTVTSDAFTGPVTLTRASANAPLTGTATVLPALKPGTYGVGSGTVATTVDVTSPGEVDPATGAFRVDSLALAADGMLVTPAYGVGQTVLDRPDQKVLGPGWRPQLLAGLTGQQLADQGGSVQISTQDGETRRYDRGEDGTFRSAEGGTLTKDAADRITEHDSSGVDFTWSRAATGWLVTAVGTADDGTARVVHDDQGRVAKIVAPLADNLIPPTCGTDAGFGCAALTLHYATTTTAGDQLGDFAGRLKEITHTADGVPTTTAQSFRYDAAGRLRDATADTDREAYQYDERGLMTELTSTETGGWRFEYDPAGRLVQQSRTSSGLSAQAACLYASQYAFGECWAIPVWKGSKRYYPGWRKTPKGKWVVGVDFDRCSIPKKLGGPPGDKRFWKACDMHDYLIMAHDSGKLPSRIKKSAVDAVFYTVMKTYSCGSAYCKAKAWAYYKAVRHHRPNW
ncbi:MULTISPECIES: RHS repeat domain-containing protein [unclassified Saccharothrix]|uniref:RHS repeat domain-containing protein n=1 Tax=unclassified Saccharothrix TaxID=2593673 RepID=UPI00307D2055